MQFWARFRGFRRGDVDAAAPRCRCWPCVGAPDAHRSGAQIRDWGEADDHRRIGGFAEDRRRASRPAGARRLADCNPRHRLSWVLLAAGPSMPGLCVLCVLCGSSLSQQQQQQQNNHREHRAEQTDGRQQGDRQLRCASGGAWIRDWGEADDRRRIDGFAEDRRRASGREDACRAAWPSVAPTP